MNPPDRDSSGLSDHARSRQAVATGGLDIGATKIAAALVDPAGETLLLDTLPTNVDKGAEAVLETADELIDLLTRSATDRGLKLTALGVGVPELVDLEGRVASSAVIPCLSDRNLARRWEHAGTVVIESDVRAAAIAEARMGAGRNCSSFAYISVGTGISYCLVIGGQPWPGSRGGAILLGSSVMAECDGDPWVLEEIASGAGLLKRYRQLGGEHSAVIDLMDPSADDNPAASVIGRGARALGIGIASIVNLLDPAAIVVGGGLGSADGPYWDQALESAREHVYWARARDLPIVHAELGATAGAIGAALVGLLRAAIRDDDARD